MNLCSDEASILKKVADLTINHLTKQNKYSLWFLYLWL